MYRFAHLLGVSTCLILLGPIAVSAQPAIEAAQGYAEAVHALDRFIAQELADKHLPGLSIALVDDQRIVWARGFGFEDPEARKPATAETVYRVGSVSKLFTDIAVMQLVEQGKLDLDAPVTNYLPSFKPKNPFGKPITLREMMTHRSGLVRESPVGHYFDDTSPPLAKMVESLNSTTLVYEPTTRIKYSNAAIATVGFTLEKVTGAKFDEWVSAKVLQPLGMKSSSFKPTDEVTKRLAKSLMWTYHGREFPAPTFELGMAPAGCMYSTVNDLARFISVMFNDGKTASGRILKPETIQQMLTPQFPKKEDKTGYGIGFSLSDLDGKKRVGHGGAIYGFSTDLAFLPSEKLGVVVVASRDFSNRVLTRIADTALKFMMAVKNGRPLPEIEATQPLGHWARELAGRYRPLKTKDTKKHGFDLVRSGERLWLWPAEGGLLVELRAEPKSDTGERFVTDGIFGFGQHFVRAKTELTSDKTTYYPVDQGPYANRPPADAPKYFRGLIGEYGWDHDTLFIFEKDGKLHALIEWFFDYPLKEESEDVYAFPDESGLYLGEKLIFHRDKNGKATEAEVASVLFKRRHLDGEDGKTFRIRPVKPVDELRKVTATPPTEKGPFRKPDFVELISLDPTIKLDLRYATTNNFLGTPLYPPSAKAYMQKPAAEALARVNKSLEADGYGLLIHDSYRPWQVTKLFWDATPARFHNFVADPSQGSRHNRGCAVDLTLYDLKTGKPIEMVGGYDEFSDRSYPDYIGGTSRQRWHRDLLRRRMEDGGFTVYEAEWWHFDYKDWRNYGIQNLSFDELAKQKP